MTIDLRQLRYLTAVIQYSSFSTAALHLNVTQPALTKSMRKLEEFLGVKLVERGASGVRPTIYGAHLNAYAKIILATVTEAQQEIDALRGGSKGQMRIGAVPSAMNTLLPRAIREFVAMHPHVQISISAGLNETLLTSLTEGVVDVAIVVMPPRGRIQALQDIDFKTLQESEIGIICSHDHPLAGSRSVSLEQLTGYEWVVPGRLEPDRRQLDQMFTSANLPAPSVVTETTSVTMLRAMMAGTTYLSYLTRQSVQTTEDFVVLPLDRPTWVRTTIAAYRRHSSIRPLLRSFLDTLESAAARH